MELDKLLVKIEADLTGLKKGLAQAQASTNKAGGSMSKAFASANASLDRFSATALKVGGILTAVFGGIAIKGFLDTSIQIENLQVRMNALFGSASEGSKAFQEMVTYAGQVPFQLGEIQRGSGSLAVVSKDAEELGRLLEVTGNVASITGLDFKITAEQIQRSFAGGIASADLFRDRGVRAMLGFEVGAKVSIEDTQKRFFEVFGKGGKFGQASDELAKTLTGTASMIGDKFFQFQVAVGDGFFDKLKGQMRNLDTALANNQNKIEAYGRVVGQALSVPIMNAENILISLGKTLQAIGSLIVATFTVNILAGFYAGLLVVIGAVKTLAFNMSKLDKNMLMVIGKILVSIAVYMKLDGIFEDFNKKLERQTELIKIEKERLEILNKIFDLNTAEIAKNSEALSENTKRQAELQEQAKKIGKIFDEINVIVDDAGVSIGDAFGKAVVEGEKFGDALKQIMKDVASQIVSVIVQVLILEPLIKRLKESLTEVRNATPNLMDSVMSGLSLASGINGLQSGGGTGGGLTPPISGKALGGYVNPNTPYMVGERGAEMFVPKSAGTIVPSAGGGIVINQSLNFSTGVQQTVRSEIRNMMPSIKQQTVSAVAEARSRGGSFAKTFGA